MPTILFANLNRIKLKHLRKPILYSDPKGEKRDKDVAKGKGGKRNSLAPIPLQAQPLVEEQPPPPPLELSISLKLSHWKTAMDCFTVEAQGTEPEIRTPSNK